MNPPPSLLKQNDFSKQCWLFLNKPSHWCKKEPFAGDSEHNRATWQSRQPAEIHLNAFRKLLYVCPACERGRREEKGLKEKRACEKRLRALTPSFLATRSARWNPEFCRTLWICFFFFCIQNRFIVVSLRQSLFFFPANVCNPLNFTSNHTHISTSMNFQQQHLHVLFFHCNLSSLSASDLLNRKPPPPPPPSLALSPPP